MEEARKAMTDGQLADFSMSLQRERTRPKDEQAELRKKRKDEVASTFLTCDYLSSEGASESEGRKASPKSVRDASMATLVQLLAPSTPAAADVELKKRKLDIEERKLALAEKEQELRADAQKQQFEFMKQIFELAMKK
jgi:hypothetical protein